MPIRCNRYSNRRVDFIFLQYFFSKYPLLNTWSINYFSNIIDKIVSNLALSKICRFFDDLENTLVTAAVLIRSVMYAIITLRLSTCCKIN